MARLKRSSTVLDAARRRLAGLKSITPPPDFGPNLKLADYEHEIDALDAKVAAYNEALSGIDDLKNQLEAGERSLREWSARMLSAAEAQYGPDSSAYEQAGGTRQSERKRPTKRSSSKG